MNEEIGKLLAKAEQLGAEGNVDESQKILMEVEKVRAKKKEAEVGDKNVLEREEVVTPELTFWAKIKPCLLFLYTYWEEVGNNVVYCQDYTG